MFDIDLLKRKVLTKQSEADGLAKFYGDTAAADIQIAKAQAFASVLRCIENIQRQGDKSGQLTKPR